MPTIYLSICIPTNGRIEILKQTLDSIYRDSSLNLLDFEVVLSDNSNNDDLLSLLDLYKCYENIVYVKSNSLGFLNSVNALKSARGLFLKLHNNYTMFCNGKLSQIISFIKEQEINKPLVFFSNGAVGRNATKCYESFDSFIYNLSYWNSWSSGFSIWKCDFDKLSLVDVNKYFPHTSLINLQNRKSSFIIYDDVCFVNQEVLGKGGYNLFRVFSVDYLQIMEELLNSNIISKRTFLKIKFDLFNIFLVGCYEKFSLNSRNHTYDLSCIHDSLKIYYGRFGFFKLLFLSYILHFKIILIYYIKSIKILNKII